MKTIRTFLAINLDLAAVRSVAEEQRRLKQSCEAAGVRVRWVPPANMHVTIRFLGPVTEPMISAVRDALEPMTRSFAPFEVESFGLGAFPDAEQARVVWSGVRCESGELERLYAKVSKLLEDTGFAAEKRPFKSHVTIGRIKSGDSAGLPDCLAGSAEKEQGTSTIRYLICYRSDLQPTGADYHAMWRLPLLGRGTGTPRSGYRSGSSTTETKE
ncbi:MAG: RNA 2',3'-cyclic phosphodiesterase [Deltaproteobacteria bacterium]|nr:RNA 2',3'-cyclic phosphodiesterase [Deltaproteobacteria bacterium]